MHQSEESIREKLAEAEAEFAGLKDREEGLKLVIAGYRRMLPSEPPARDDEDEGGGDGYGSIRAAVLEVVAGSRRRMKAADIAAELERRGMTTTASKTIVSVRNALRGLQKSNRVKRVGIRYSAVKSKEAAG